MDKKKKQKIIDGSIIEINLEDSKFIFARLIKNRISVYDFIVSKSEPMPGIDVIISKPIIFYCGIYNDIITKGVFKIIGFKELTQDEIDNIPPSFSQDMVDINDCKIYYWDGREFKATPKDCIGLEKFSVLEVDGLIDRIKDYYSGKKNVFLELDKPILSTDDLRYLPPPNALRWNFEKQEFYRIEQS